MDKISDDFTAATPAIDDMADDTLRGAAAIAAFLRMTLRQTQYLLEDRRLPAFKLNGRWHMRKSAYAAFISRLESEVISRLESEAESKAVRRTESRKAA